MRRLGTRLSSAAAGRMPAARRSRRRATCLVASVLVVASACSSSGKKSSAAPGTGVSTPGSSAAASDKCTADKAGGTLTFGVFSETRGLDPTVTTGSGTTGGTELQAIYDTLMRWDLASNKYVPWVAQSLTPNADATQWTLKLRPGVKFGDGNPLTAAAVKASIARHQDANNHSVVYSDVSQISSMDAQDDQTLVFTLAAPWGTFPHVLADLGGMIVDTSVVTKMGAAAFNKFPRGAGVGPFEIVSFTPGESIVMEPKKDYWGGPVCIQQLKFVPSQTPQATLDALKLGQIQAAYIRDPNLVAQEKSAGLVAYDEVVGLGSILQINSSYNNPPTADVRLRQAIAYAVDPKAIDTRVNNGTGIPTSAIMPKSSPIYPGIDGLPYDPAKAKQLVAEVKASGWNGKLNIVCPNTNDTGIVIQAELQAVGIDATLAAVSQQVAIARTITNHDYDTGCGGPSVSVAAPNVRLDRYFGAKNTFTGFRNDAFNAALQQLKAAVTTADIKAAMAKVQQVWNDTVPSVGLGASDITIGAGKNVHGLVFNENATAYFGSAYIK